MSHAAGSSSSVRSGRTSSAPPSESRCQEDSVVPSSLFFQPLSCRGPAGRWAHAAVSVGRTHMVIFGGIGSALLGDLWMLDMEACAWRAVQATTLGGAEPPDKVMAAAAAAVGHRVWVFGGQKGRTHTRKLHVLDVHRHVWYLPGGKGSLPSARAGHAMTTVGTAIYMFGGAGKKLYNDLHRLDTDIDEGSFVEVKTAGQPPLPRQGMAFLYDGADCLVCFGGTSSSGIDGSLAAFSLRQGAWHHPQQNGRAPSPRTNHAAVLLAPHIILVCGGCNSAGTFFADCHVLDTRDWTWSQPQSLNPGFAPRYNHTVCLGPNGRVFLYGGVNSKQTFDSVITMDTKDTIGDDLSAVAAELESLARTSASTTARESCDSSFSNREMDLMRIQLTDMLYKRNMEEHLHQASSRAEASEQQLTWTKEQLEHMRAENLQLGLLCVEAEEGRRAEQQATREAEARAAKAQQALADAQAAHDTTRAQLAKLQAEADTAHQLQEDHVRELGILSSRYTKLQQQYSAVCRRLALLGDRSTADSASSSRNLLVDGDQEGCGLPPSSSLPGHAASTHERLLDSQDIGGHGDPKSKPQSQLAGAIAHLSLGRDDDRNSGGGGGSAGMGCSDTQSQFEVQDQVFRLTEQLGSVTAERDQLRQELQQIQGQAEALSKLPVSRLQALERTLEAALRATREAVLSRRIAEVEQRAVSETQCCSLCLERPRGLVFNCGHQTCQQCGEQLPTCPFCRKEITLRVKLFSS